MDFYAICGFLALVWFLLVLGHWRAALAVIGAPIFIGLCIYAAIVGQHLASGGELWAVLPDWLEDESERRMAKPVPQSGRNAFQDLIPPERILDGQGGALRKSDALKPLHKPEQDRLPR